jgi:uncharacterized protein (DUF169 family)
MSRWDGAVKEVSDYLGLRYPPVAVSYREKPDPAAPVSKRFGCNAIFQAFRGKVINLDRGSISCPGAVHWLGFDDYRPGLTLFLTHGEKLFASEELTEKWLNHVPPPRPAPQGHLVLKPLATEEEEPELVLLLVNAHQAHRIHSILNYREGDLMIPHFYSAICQGTITNPISLNKPTVTFPDTMGRDVGGFGENDIIFSFPLAYFLRLVEDLRASDGGEEKIAPGVKDLLKMIH